MGLEPGREGACLPVVAYFDGLCEPNPGGHGCGGYVIEPHEAFGGKRVVGNAYFGKDPEMTNNVAEYRAALLALKAIWRAGYRGDVALRGDSQLVVRQFGGEYACNKVKLQELLARLRKAKGHFASLTLEWVSRDDNAGADRQSRAAYKGATGREPPVRGPRAANRRS